MVLEVATTMALAHASNHLLALGAVAFGGIGGGLVAVMASWSLMTAAAAAGTEAKNEEAEGTAGQEPQTVGPCLLTGRNLILGCSLSCGASGVVYAARCARDPRQAFAVKVVSTSQGESLEMEARAMMEVRHPNILKLRDMFRDGSRMFFVMEMAAGDLTAVLAQRRRLSEDESKRVAGQVSSALKHLHDRSLLHRDVKPANILVRQLGAPRPRLDLWLADLGQCCRGPTATGPSGTRGYSAPEQLRQFCRYGYAVDIWALGCMMYQALSGMLPWRPSLAPRTTYKLSFSGMEISGVCKAFVKNCLKPDPRERASAQQVLQLEWLTGRTQARAEEPEEEEEADSESSSEPDTISLISDSGELLEGMSEDGEVEEEEEEQADEEEDVEDVEEEEEGRLNTTEHSEEAH